MHIVVFIFLFYFLSSLFTYTLIARGEQKRMMYINAIIAIFNLIGNLIFIPYFSFIGSAWVTLGTQILLLGVTWWYVRENIETREILRFSLPVLVLSIFSVICAWYGVNLTHLTNTTFVETFIRLAIAGVIFGSIFFSAIFVFVKKFLN